MVVAGLLFSIKSEEKRFTKQTWLNMIPGVMWATGNLALLFSNKLVGIATGFSLSQMGVVISTIGGILFLGEKNQERTYFGHYRSSLSNYRWHDDWNCKKLRTASGLI